MERIYPTAPTEEQSRDQEQGRPLRQAPPSYDQATAKVPIAAPIATPAQTTGPSHTVIIVPPSSVAYGPGPVDVQCPFCHNFIRTRVRFRPNSRTHLIALLLCLFQLYCCVCLPYCIGSCMNTNHYCGMCDHYLGTYVRN
ncbi:lipopolysaccharide-induced tumor necrosis factor-alpha factor homolog [Scaptodrosophila lebanonensis]|uniref:Lipopolysaccharide-induced tumor necrosis factor-alpha factor homolog n=1 Tax=Drosophila lebanonensis TaxID=7225 RepID=A0A6J2UHL0_DROLE|nr:lipopolysaccharide-induced tumor necrosis factor-alpha factor homolog [Scaptodrosophila lebanonensis]